MMSTHLWGVSWPSMIVMMLLLWGGVVAVVVALAHSWQHRDHTSPRLPSPQSVLEDRFARGEIDADELARQLEVLRKLGS